MKGLILAGGNATRLRPLTWVTNKHLLPVYDKPMIFYPLESMKKAGVKDVLIITNPDHAGQFVNLFSSGRNFGLHLEYGIQDKPGGLAQAVSLAENFADKGKLLVILGDNIFHYNLKPAVTKFLSRDKGAVIFAKEMANAKEYGVIELDKAGKVLSIEEKPQNPKSNYVQTGIYMYDHRVFDFIKNLKPSRRGELEITDLNNIYVKEGSMECTIMDGWWVDAGTSYEELLRANQVVAEVIKKGHS
jgi:glucose-1-phosphate thymidylyltransferase